MKSLFNKYVWLQLILSILLLFGGVLIIVFAAMQKNDILEDALNIIVAVILFLFGGFTILASFVFEHQKVFTVGLLVGAASLAAGIFFCVSLVDESGLVLINYVIQILAIFFITLGGLLLLKAIIMTARKYDGVFFIVIAYIASVLAIAAGILALIFGKGEDGIVRIVACIIGGLLLFAGGVYELVFGVSGMIKFVKAKGDAKRKDKKKDKKQAAVEPVNQDGNIVDSEPVEEVPEKEEIKEIDYTETKQIEQK